VVIVTDRSAIGSSSALPATRPSGCSRRLKIYGTRPNAPGVPRAGQDGHMADTSDESRELMVIGVPIDCVGAPTPDDAPFGTELAPGALRSAGVVAALGAADAGDLDVRLIGRDRDLETGVLGWPAVREVTGAVRARVQAA